MNKVILLGRICKDIELRYSQSGTAFGSFSLAVDRKFSKDKETDFINCKAFGKTAETISKYLGKGRQVVVEGRIQTGSYDNKEGQKVYTTDVMVDSFYFADSKTSKNESSNTSDCN